MIYIAKQKINEKDFIDLLEKSRKLILNFLKGKKNISSIYFETIVFEQMCKAAKRTPFEGLVIQTEIYDFPDIIANKYFGVEVKMTANDHWTSTGNSVLESSRKEDVKRIYIVFGKLGGKSDVRYRLYQECLPEVSVTHSPRYRINMNLPKGKSIFDKMGVDYDKLRLDANPIRRIKDYYRSKLKDGEELWWIDQDSDDKLVSPIIRPFRSLSEKEQENFIVEAMILFPEMFSKSSIKFERTAAYLIAEYNAVSASLRDIFTAGGVRTLNIKGRRVVVPQLAYKLNYYAKAVVIKIKDIESNKLAYYWRCRKIKKDHLGQWKKFINKKFPPIKPRVKASDIFEAGLL